VPKRHGADFFALPIEDQQAIHALTRIKRERLADQYAPNAFNVGVNVGADPGQTVGHAHMHLIPRYFGDTEDPRGGVRWIIPEKAVYWEGR
jgi:diadenosine tetraphosphate (Ap4A) HIT family hydrolase